MNICIIILIYKNADGLLFLEKFDIHLNFYFKIKIK